MRIFPDLEKMVIGMTLHNMKGDNRQMKTMGCRFRIISSQLQNEDDDGDLKKDAFALTCDKYYDRHRVIDLKLGSPQVLTIPDTLPDLCNFITIDEPKKEDHMQEESCNEEKHNEE